MKTIRPHSINFHRNYRIGTDVFLKCCFWPDQFFTIFIKFNHWVKLNFNFGNTLYNLNNFWQKKTLKWFCTQLSSSKKKKKWSVLLVINRTNNDFLVSDAQYYLIMNLFHQHRFPCSITQAFLICHEISTTNICE